MTRAGRPTKRTPETEKLLLGALQEGNTRTAACQIAGISLDTLARWIVTNADFCGAVLRAEAAAKVTAVRAIQLAIRNGSWRAALAWYERRYPAEMGMRSHVDVTVVREQAEQIARELGGVTAEEIIAEAERIARGRDR
jgi:hypothetical protein